MKVVPCVVDKKRCTFGRENYVPIVGDYICVALDMNGEPVKYYKADIDVALSEMKPVLREVETILLGGDAENYLDNPRKLNGNLYMFAQEYDGGARAGMSVAVIMRTDILREIENMLGAFYLLPSSRFEWLVAPVRDEDDIMELRGIVRSINHDTVKEKDILSNDILKFAEGRLSAC